MQHGVVKTEARLDEEPNSPTQGPENDGVRFLDNPAAVGAADGQAWQHHPQVQQKDATEGVPAGPEFTPRRGRVTFAASAGASEQADAAAPGTAAAVHDNSKQRHVHIASDASSTEVFESGGAQHDGVAAPGTTPAAGFLNRFRKSFADSKSHGQADGSSPTILQHVLSSKQGSKQATGADAEQGGANTAAKSQAGPSIFSASLKGFFGGASSRLLGSLMGRAGTSSKAEPDAEEEEEDLWFTSLDDFKPICHMLHKGRYMSAYFACANKTGQHFLLKKFDKHKMLPAEERGVRRSIAFSELLQHQNLVKCMGQWEAEDIIYVVEEYAGKGDVFNDAISHPEKYTERYVAVTLVKPLLRVLAHLHANNIIHRSVLPENLYMAIDDVLKLGHLTLAVDQLSDRPKSRTALLDYMAPEMLSVKPHNEHELAHALEDSSDEDEQPSQGEQQALGQGHAAEHQQRQQQQQQHSSSGQHQHQQQHSQLDVMGRPLAAAAQQHQHPELLAAAEGPEAFTVTSRSSSRTRPRSRSSGLIGAVGQAEWEYMDYYDEKVDIWQVGCMVHELLCGSMPFEVDSKLDSGGLALWADIEQPPGSLPPDCINFLQLALTKDPKQRPAAEQLMQHPWLARCESGEPWRDPAELEAARKAAELATVSGWLRHNGRAVVAGLSGFMQHVLHGSRVQPMGIWVDHQQQQGDFLTSSDPGSPSKRQTSRNLFSMHTIEEGSSPGSHQVALHLPLHGLNKQQSWGEDSMQQQPSGHTEAQSDHQAHHHHSNSHSGRPDHSSPAPLKLTEELVGRLNAGWEAEQRNHSSRKPKQGSQGSAADSVEQVGQPEDGDDILDDEVQAACVIQVPRTSPFAHAASKKGVGFAVMPGEALVAESTPLPQQQTRFGTLGMV